MPDEYQSPDDERQDQGPTPDELQAAELAKTAQTLQLVREMNQTVAPLPATLPTQTAPVGAAPAPPMTATQPPPTAPVAPPPLINRGGQQYQGSPLVAAPPAPQGRMYMGPAMSPDQESAFMQSPAGTRINLMPPPSGPPPSRLEQAQANDQPGSRTIAINDEPAYSDASLANQRNAMLYNAMKQFDAGDRSPEVMAAVLGKSASPGKRYNVAGVGLVDENGKVITAHPDSPQTRMVQGVGLVDAKTGRVITPSVQKPETQTVTEHIPRKEGVAGTPAQPARKAFLGIGARAAVPAVPEVPTQEAQTISRKVPVEAPASAAKSVQPMPKEKSQLVSGRVYQTSKGPAKWDGEYFVKE